VRETEIQRANLQLALLPAGMWSDRLASCARQGRPQGTDGLQIWTGCKEREQRDEILTNAKNDLL